MNVTATTVSEPAISDGGITVVVDLVLLGLGILAVSWAMAIAYITWLYIGIAKWANRAKWEGPK